MRKEILSKRNLNSKHFDIGNRKFVMEAHVGHIHYKDRTTGKFEECDIKFREENGEFIVDKASYEIKIPKKLNKVKFWANEKWLDIEPMGIKLNIEGKIVNDPETTHKGNTIRFDNIYGQGIHLEFVCRTGSVKKYIVFDQKPDKFDWKFKLTGFDKDKHILWKPRIFDSNGKAKSIEYDIKGGTLTKHLPEEFFNDAVYPVRTDTTTSYYAGVGDGWVVKSQAGSITQTLWDTIHDITTGSGSSYTDTTAICRIELNGAEDNMNIYRIFFPIDTSGIPDDDVISAAVLKLYVQSKDDDYNGDGYDYVAVVKTFQVSTSTLVTADYEDCGYDTGNETGGRAKYLAVKGSSDIDITGLSTVAYTDFTLNATGRGWINKTGITMLGLREGHDIEDNYPGDPGAADKRSMARIYNSEQTDTGNDPYLSVTYAPPGTNMEINIGDAWKTVDGIEINIGDAWKEVTKVQLNVGDVWKTIFE